MPVLDFKELSSSRSGSPAGEDLEGLVRELGKRLGLNPEWAGRGADQGRDLFFIEHRRGPIGSHELRWLVSCKDFANSGRSVSESDAGSVSDKIAQHQAHGFLLATTTTASAGLKAMLDGIHARGEVETRVWDRHELENFLLQDEHVDLVKRHFPLSYSAFRRLNSLPQALESLATMVPVPVYKRIREVIETYQVEGSWLTGGRIWPHDRASATTIDLVIAALLEQGDPKRAAQILSEEEIEFDAFEAALKTLTSFKPAQTEELCRELILAKDTSGSSLFAYRFYVDHFQPNNEGQIILAVSLSSEDLYELYAEEIATFIEDDLVAEPQRYRAWSDLDILSSQTILEEAYSDEIRLTASPDNLRINFCAAVTLSVSLTYDREGPNSDSSFPGVVEGYVDATGIFIQDVTVDTGSFYE